MWRRTLEATPTICTLGRGRSRKSGLGLGPTSRAETIKTNIAVSERERERPDFPLSLAQGRSTKSAKAAFLAHRGHRGGREEGGWRSPTEEDLMEKVEPWAACVCVEDAAIVTCAVAAADCSRL